MTREKKILKAIEMGYTCDPDTGEVFGKRGNKIGNIANGYKRFTFNFDKIVYRIYHHQFIYYWVNKMVCDQIDHININRLDNRISNLRSINNQENHFNTNAKGAYWSKKHKKWKSCIHLNGKGLHLGTFDTEEEAREAYLEAKKKYHIIKNPSE